MQECVYVGACVRAGVCLCVCVFVGACRPQLPALTMHSWCFRCYRMLRPLTQRPQRLRDPGGHTGGRHWAGFELGSSHPAPARAVLSLFPPRHRALLCPAVKSGARSKASGQGLQLRMRVLEGGEGVCLLCLRVLVWGTYQGLFLCYHSRWCSGVCARYQGLNPVGCAQSKRLACRAMALARFVLVSGPHPAPPTPTSEAVGPFSCSGGGASALPCSLVSLSLPLTLYLGATPSGAQGSLPEGLSAGGQSRAAR